MSSSSSAAAAGSAFPGNLADLKADFKGSIVVPDDGARYTEMAVQWNVDALGRPSAIATVADVDDVVAAVNYARKNNVLLAIASGRHSHTCMVDNSLVIDFSAMTACTVDPDNQTVTLESGVKLGQMDVACEPHGLATTAGHNPDTGVAGLTLGGGLGNLSRLFGLTIDNLLEVQAVTAEGAIVTASPTENADLFWGVCGGGGNFAVVTRFQLRLHKVPSAMASGTFVVPPVGCLGLFPDPTVFLRKTRDYLSTAAPEIGTTIIMPTGGPLVVSMMHAGETADGMRELRRLKSDKVLGGRSVGGVKAMSYHTGIQRAAEDQQRSGKYYEKGFMVNELSDEALDTLWEVTHQDIPNKACTVLAIHVGGGAIANRASDETAFYHRDVAYWILILGNWKKDSEREQVVAWARNVYERCAAFRTGDYNTIGKVLDEDGTDLFGGHAIRLRELKDKYDPTNLFKCNRNILPSSASSQQ